MKLIIFGATGTVGRHVVEQALRQGHEVTAFTRTRYGSSTGMHGCRSPRETSPTTRRWPLPSPASMR